MSDEHGTQALRHVPLDAAHRRRGARMVPFAGWQMPLQYRGIIAEHTHCRTAAALFDVSHMGQARLTGDDPAAALETLVPGDIRGLGEGHTRYTMLTNDAGGIIDDLMVSRRSDGLFLVVNASRRTVDFAHIAARLQGRATLEVIEDRALLALQGPAAAEVLGRLAPDCRSMAFMSAAEMDLDGAPCLVTRSGYTGEDGFEVSVSADAAEGLFERLLAEPEVAPAGLGARDSLRLEAGLCLYGNDITEDTSPIEAGLAWAVGRRRRAEGGFPGAERILAEISEGPSRRRIGLRLDGKVPARAHAAIVSAAGASVGMVTSGGYGPTVGGPVAMGYLPAAQAAPGSTVALVVRERTLPARVVALPFVPHHYFKG